MFLVNFNLTVYALYGHLNANLAFSVWIIGKIAFSVEKTQCFKNKLPLNYQDLFDVAPSNLIKSLNRYLREKLFWSYNLN